MAQVSGKVASISKNEKTGWYKVKVGGETLETKQDGVIGSLEEGLDITAQYTSKKNGNFTNYYLDSWWATDNEPPKKDVGKQEKATDWDGKDRAIAMESAYSSAARFLAHNASSESEDLINLARFIYSDVERARRNEAFKQVARKQQPSDDDLPF